MPNVFADFVERKEIGILGSECFFSEMGQSYAAGFQYLEEANGINWIPADNGLTFPLVYTFAVNKSYIFARTNGEGV